MPKPDRPTDRNLLHPGLAPTTLMDLRLPRRKSTTVLGVRQAGPAEPGLARYCEPTRAVSQEEPETAPIRSDGGGMTVPTRPPWPGATIVGLIVALGSPFLLPLIKGQAHQNILDANQDLIVLAFEWTVALVILGVILPWERLPLSSVGFRMPSLFDVGAIGARDRHDVGRRRILRRRNARVDRRCAALADRGAPAGAADRNLSHRRILRGADVPRLRGRAPPAAPETSGSPASFRWCSSRSVICRATASRLHSARWRSSARSSPRSTCGGGIFGCAPGCTRSSTRSVSSSTPAIATHAR